MNDPAPPRTAAEVEALYRKSVAEQQQVCDNLAQRHAATIRFIAAVLVATVVLNFSHLLPAFWLLSASAAMVLALFVYFLHLQALIAHHHRLLEFRQRNLARSDGTQVQSGRTGLEPGHGLRTPGHLYDHDLNILGPDSLFGLLATVRTSLGERGLAAYLLHPAAHTESIERQQAVQELLPRTGLREHIAMLGNTRFQQISAALVDEWLNAEPPEIHPAFRIALLATVGLNLLLLFAGIRHILPWETVRENIALVLAVQGAIALSLRKRLHDIIETNA